MPDKILDEKQRIKLDEGIKKMISYGASKDDVTKYASDFKIKFGIENPSLAPVSEIAQAQKVGTEKDIPLPSFPSLDDVFRGVGKQRAVSESTLGPDISRKVEKAIDILAIPQRKIERENKIKQTKITALDNTVKKKLDSSKVTYNVGDSIWNKAKEDTQKLVDSEDIALTVNAEGAPVYKPSLGIWGSLIESFKKSYDDEKESFVFSSANFDDKIKIANEEILKPIEAEGVPVGVGGSVGEFLGESAIMLGQAIGGAKAGAKVGTVVGKTPLSAAVGGVVGSFAAMAPSAYSKGKRNETIARYGEAINEIKSKKGFVTPEDEKTAMNTALTQGTRAGMLDVANVAVLSLPFGRVLAGKGFVKTLEYAAKTAAVDVLKFGTSSGVTQLAKDASAAQLGYNIRSSDIIKNFVEASGEGAKTALAFWTMHQVTGTIPKYLKASANEYLSSVYEPDLANMSLSLENSGVVPEGTTAETMRKLKKYNAARRKVPPVVPEENIALFAGNIEKKDNLIELKNSSDPSFHPKIDEQISAIDIKLAEMLKSDNPIELEVDDRTGDSGKAEPQTAADVETGLELIEGPENEVIKLPVEDMVGKRVRYKGKDATIFRDGMQFVLGIEGTNREVELGNVDEIGNTEISNFGIEYDGEIEIANDNSVTVRGKKYENNFSDPKSAVEYDENGYVRSVSLDTPTGQKRTFRGLIADEIAYQIKLKEIEQSDETRAKFEQFIEQDKSAKQQIVSGENEAAAEKGAVKVDETVLREKAEPTIEPIIEKPAEKEGDEVFVRLADGSSKTGAKVIVPGYEKIDFVVVKDGLEYRILELSSGMEVGDTRAFTVEESIKNAINELKAQTQETLLDAMLSKEKTGRIRIVNRSEAYETYKQQKSKEYEGLPSLYSEEEIAKLNKYKAEAQEKGLDDVVSIIDSVISQRKTSDKTRKMRDIDFLRNSIDNAYKKKVIEESKSKQIPIPEEFNDAKKTGSESELESAVNYSYKKNQYQSLPENIKEIARGAWKKQAEIINKYGYTPNKSGSIISDIERYVVIKNGKNAERIAELLPAQESKIIETANAIDKFYAENIQQQAGEVKPSSISIGQAGEQGTAIFAEGVEVPFRYKIIEADELKPSHLPSGERNPEHTIALAQPKERNDIESKLAQDSIAKNPRLELSGESPFAYYGAPIVNSRGEVIQGNNRSLGLKKHYANEGVEYKQQLSENAENFGFTSEQVNLMKNPILVREIPVDDAMAVELGNYDVKDTETGSKQRIDPIVTVRRFSTEDKQKLSSLIFDGDYATVKEAIRTIPKEIGLLISKYINAAQRNTIFDKEGNINAKGMDDIENIVNNLIFESGSAVLPEAFNELPYSEQKNIQKAIKHIFSIPEEASILPEVQVAIKGLYDFHTSGIGNFENWLRQSDVFEGKTPRDIFNPLEIKIMEIINKSKTQSGLSKELAKYSELVNGKPADMFDAEVKGISKNEAIKQQFNIDYGDVTKRYAEPKGETGAEKIVREKNPKSRKYEIPREDRIDRDYREGEQDAIRQQLDELGGVEAAYEQYKRDGYEKSGWTLEDYLIKKACG